MQTSKISKKIKDLIRPIDTVINVNNTIAEAISTLRQKKIDHKVIYFYVVDDNRTLLGIIPTRSLLLCKPDCKISDVMEPSVIRITENQTLQDAMNLFVEYNLLAIPVVDTKGLLLGAIDVSMYMEESFDIADASHRKDIFQLIGISLEEEKKRSIFGDYRLRMPWIFCNMLGGFACAIISRMHEIVLSKFLLLAFFIPLVLTLSESVSMQSMIHGLHFLRRARVSWKKIFYKSFKEWQIVLLIALSSGILVGVISLLWGDGFLPSLAIGFGILFSVAISAAVGIFLPIILHKSKLDPKVASGPIVLMFADVLTTALYLWMASWLLL